MKKVVFAILLSVIITGTGYPERKASVWGIIDVSIRHSMIFSKTGVLVIRSEIDECVYIKLAVRNKDTQQHLEHYVSLKPYGTAEVGFLEMGWMFEPNEILVITCEGYKPAFYKTFKTDSGKVGIKPTLWPF